MSTNPQTVRAAFLDEVTRALALVEAGILQLEQGDADVGVLDAVLRHAHTLKGSARLLKAAAVHALAVMLENALHPLRDAHALRTPPQFDTLLTLCDQIRLATQQFVHMPAAAEPSGPPPQDGPAPSTARDTADEDYLRIPLSRVNALLHLTGDVVIHTVQSAHTLTMVRQVAKAARGIEQAVLEVESAAHGGPAGTVSADPRRSVQLLASRVHAVRRALTAVVERMTDAHCRIDPQIAALQQQMKALRMVPCTRLFEGCARAVRDVARQQGKQVRLALQGAETELDKMVLDALRGPLLHLVRNAIDHGIETPAERTQAGKAAMGTVTLTARAAGDRVVVSVHDDGRGIDCAAVQRKALQLGVVTADDIATMDAQAALQLIFAPGVSTAARPGDISGRGVGLDVVHAALHTLRGACRVQTDPQRGTTFELVLPLTITLQRVLLVEVAQTIWAIPLLSVEETVAVAPHAPMPSIQVLSLTGLLGWPDHAGMPGAAVGAPRALLVVQAEHRRVGVLVDRVLGEEEVFVKGLGAHLGHIDGVRGAALLPDGSLRVVLDLPTLVMRAALPRKRILLVDDSATARIWEERVLVAAGYDVETAADGCEAMERLRQHRFDAVITDVQMPRMDGVELYERIRADRAAATTPVIFVTALAEAEMQRRVRTRGRTKVLQKNQLEPQQLLEMIARVIR